MPNPCLLRAALALLLLYTTAVQAELRADAGWDRQARAISASADTAARRQAITDRLDALAIVWRREPFERQDRAGTNLVADLGGAADAPLLLIGAHYDRVEVGQGATDNASGVAAVLDLAARLRAQPLANHRVQLAFWDLEEHGLLGSRAWIATEARERPALYVNFDVFAWGDTLWMMAPLADHPLVQALRAETAVRGLGFSAGEHYPPTDHLAFLEADWPAVSLSLVGGNEIAPILAMFGGQQPESTPRVLQIIHSERDTPAEFDAAAVKTALAVLERGLRRWDAAAEQARGNLESH